MFASSPRLCHAENSPPREWLLITDIYGNSLHRRLTVIIHGHAVAGTLDGDALKGKIAGNLLHFVATDNRGNTTEVEARLAGDKVTGQMLITFSNAPKEHIKHSFYGYALRERPAGPARTIEFAPAEFYNRFSADIAPVATIWPGDTIHTKTIDSGGVDEHGVTRALYGNPQTGPFYVGEAESGIAVAQNKFGACYEKGEGVPKDYLQAYKWYALSAAQDDQRAVDIKVSLARLEAQLTKDQIAEAQRLARDYKSAEESDSARQTQPAISAPATPESGKMGYVSVKANDDHYEVFVDGAFVGNPPAKLKLAEGSHVIEVKKSGFKDYRRELKVMAGSDLTLTAGLERLNSKD